MYGRGNAWSNAQTRLGKEMRESQQTPQEAYSQPQMLWDVVESDPLVPKAPAPSFDAKASEEAKQAGITLAVENRKELVDAARAIAIALLKERDSISMDDVVQAMPRYGLDPNELGNSAGGIFKCATFKWTGEYTLSKRVASHRNRLMTWKLA
jgi:hypothetical protein